MAYSQAGKQPVVTVAGKEMVMPAKPTEKHSYFLSCLDLFWTENHYNQRVLFYESTGGLLRERSVLPGQEVVTGQKEVLAADGWAVMEKLKSSLALCLVHYYPWCGRLTPGEPGGHTRPAIDCNDAGVEFVEAYLDLPISLLSQQGFQVKPFFEKLCQHVDHSGDCLYSSPLLSIQATLFSDGGLALGISHSHVVADGQSLWNFMVSWGECARGMPLSAPPELNREKLAVRDPSPQKAATWKGITYIKVEEEEETVQTVDDPLVQKNGDRVGTPSPLQEDKVGSAAGIARGDIVGTDPPAPKLVQCVFNLPSSAVKNLKVEDGGVHTSYEVAYAHLWQRLTAARQRPSHDHTWMVVLANGRSRVNPPLPSAYFGNAIGFLINISTVGKVCSETLRATTNRIHGTVVELVDSFVGFMHWLETHENKVLSWILQQISKENGINVASSPRFPVYEVDFGWGKPEAVRAPRVQGDGEMVLFGGHPRLNPGDLEICTALPEDVLRRLLEDPTFRGKPPSSPFAN